MRWVTAAAAIMLGACSPGRAPDSTAVPPWVSEKTPLLVALGIDPVADLEITGNYHWRWLTKRAFKAGDYQCPAGATVDISRSIVAVRPPPDLLCKSPGRADARMLRVGSDGSAEPI